MPRPRPARAGPGRVGQHAGAEVAPLEDGVRRRDVAGRRRRASSSDRPPPQPGEGVHPLVPADRREPRQRPGCPRPRSRAARRRRRSPRPSSPYAARVLRGELGGDQRDAARRPARTAARPTPEARPSRRRRAGTATRLSATQQRRAAGSRAAPRARRPRSVARRARRRPRAAARRDRVSSSARVCRPTRNMLISPTTIAPKAVACQVDLAADGVERAGRTGHRDERGVGLHARRGPVELGLGGVEALRR